MKEVNWAEVNDNAKDLFDQKKYKEAVELFESNIGDGNFPEAILLNYAKCLYYNMQADLALRVISPLLENSPTHETQIDYALYLNAVGDSYKAFDVLRSLKNQDDPKVKFNLGWHYLRRGEFIEGFDKIQHGAQCRAWGNEYQYIEQGILDPKKRWDGRSKGKILYILEGGLGDQIIFLRWADHIVHNINSTVVVACDMGLIRLLVNSGYNCIPHEEIKDYQYDYYIPAMSYPAIHAAVWQPVHPTDFVKFPYIKTHCERFMHYQVSRYMKSQKDPLAARIGIKWFGNPMFEHDQMRTIPKDRLIEVTKKYGALFSFQFEDDTEGIPNMKYVIKDWNDTYSAIMAMDIVVTSCTSIAHLCGAIGKKCIVMVPLVPYFTWASDKLKWYDSSITVIRQTKYNDWSEAFEVLDKTLSEIIKS